MEHLLVAVDGSEHSNRAVELAAELAECLEARVSILNVVPEKAAVIPGATHEYAHIEQLYISQREVLESVGRDVISRAARTFETRGVEPTNVTVEIGNPAHQIVSYAERIGADTIVMGRRGLGEIKGLLMGSVSHRVGQLSDKTLITAE